MSKFLLWATIILSFGLIIGGFCMINPAAGLIYIGTLLWIDLTLSVIRRKIT